MQNIYPVIMAGGRGERFWPASRSQKPKQMLKLFGDKTLIEYTVERQLQLCPLENIFVITSVDLKKDMEKILPIPAENIIGEPFGRDTAPCVGLATALIKAKGGDDAVMLLLPADQVIHDVEAYSKNLGDVADVAANHANLITIGITPTFASTGFGYIQCGHLFCATPCGSNIYASHGFKEKPDKKTAEKFLNSSQYRWNAGMFVWSVSSILDALRIHAPKIAKMVDRLVPSVGTDDFMVKLETEYHTQDKVSIDYALMEKARNILVADGTFDWDDVGSWPALDKHINHDEHDNAIKARIESIASEHNVVFSENENHLIALVGVDDLVVVHTDDATLICSREASQDIKQLVQQLRDHKADELL